jgi:putative redox protein
MHSDPILPVTSTATAVNAGQQYLTHVHSNRHELLADEPARLGGADKGPSPGDYLCMSLASCKAITVRMYAQRKNWDVGEISIKVDLVRAADSPSNTTTFYCTMSVSGTLDQQQRLRLTEIAEACPVSRMLSKPNEVITRLI